MASAYKCDRCKQYYDGQAEAGITLSLTDSDDYSTRRKYRQNKSEGSWSLCETCTVLVLNLLNENPAQKL